MLGDSLAKAGFVRVSSQVSQGFTNDNALPHPFGVIQGCMYVQLLVCGLNVRLDI